MNESPSGVEGVSQAVYTLNVYVWAGREVCVVLCCVVMGTAVAAAAKEELFVTWRRLTVNTSGLAADA